jgi:predicted secreted protein
MTLAPRTPQPLVNAGRALLVAGAALIALAAQAQDRPAPLDVLNLDVSSTSEVVPDLAVVQLAVIREGTDSGALTQEVEQVMAHALAETKSVSGVQGSSGGFSTAPSFDSHGTRIGWQLRATLVLRSRDFGALGKLAGKLSAGSDGLQVAGSGFEISPELRLSEESELVERAIAQFKARAAQASKALGYGGYTIREISVGQAQQGGGPRPMIMARSADKFSGHSTAALPIEADHITLQLDVHGSVQMRR